MNAVRKRQRKPPPHQMSWLPARLRAERKALGLHVTQLEDMAGVPRGRVSRLEKGANMTGLTLGAAVKLAEALHVRLGWLVSGEEPKDLGAVKTPTQIIVQNVLPDADAIRTAIRAELDAMEDRRELNSPPRELPIADHDK